MFVEQGFQAQAIPEGASVAAVVAHERCELFSLRDGAANLCAGVGLGVGTVQESTVSPEHLLKRVSGEREKCRIGVNDRLAWSLYVTQNHGALAGIQRLHRHP
ncbi:MAG TPA: hypothetical protein VE029_08370 [Rhizobacter sp.]|nr:hypothetical protein [Rhizobacter sp.]